MISIAAEKKMTVMQKTESFGMSSKKDKNQLSRKLQKSQARKKSKGIMQHIFHTDLGALRVFKGKRKIDHTEQGSNQ